MADKIPRLGSTKSDEISTILDLAPVSIITIDPNTLITNLNRAASLMMDKPREEIINTHFCENFDYKINIKEDKRCGIDQSCHDCDIRNAIYNAAKHGQSSEGIEFRKACGEDDINETWFRANVSPVKISGAKSIVITMLDITEIKKLSPSHLEAKVHYLRYHDQLTGLYNRKYLKEKTKHFIRNQHFPLSIIIVDIDGLKLINNSLGQDEGDKLVKEVGAILKKNCRKDDIVARTGGGEFTVLLPYTNLNEAERFSFRINSAALKYKSKVLNENCHISVSLGCATMNGSDESVEFVCKIAESNMFRHKLLHNNSFHSSLIDSMKTTMFEKSQETEEHAQRLVSLAKAIGKKLNVSEKETNELELLSILHDIGKIGIKDYVLNKPDKLTDDEWVQMRRHPEIGSRIAMASPDLAPIAEYILCHHERWDGTGYPRGLKGEEIPLLARIISVVDAYDAMTQERVYSPAMLKDAAITEILENSGTQFDPEIARIFVEIIDGVCISS